MQVLGITVSAGLVRRWIDWLAPAYQPFFLTSVEVAELKLGSGHAERVLSPELRDTYEAWGLDRGLETRWLDEHEFYALPQALRSELVQAQVEHGRAAVPAVDDWAGLLNAPKLHAQADGQHFVWWPTQVEPHHEVVLKHFVREGQLPCQRTSVPEDIWHDAAHLLPCARTLSGTFANGSRGNPLTTGSATNCFSTVMAATGLQNADAVAFENWLLATCTPGGNDERPGTILVWRNMNAANTHAAVTIGGGWALHKPSQEWRSPRQILPVTELVRLAPAGVTLHRYTLQSP